MAVEILIPFFVFASAFGAIYMFLTTRNRERLALIEKGMEAKIFKEGTRKSYWALRIGLAMVGFAMGVFLGTYIATGSADEEPIVISLAFMLGGAGLVASFWIERKLNKENEEIEHARKLELLRQQEKMTKVAPKSDVPSGLL